LQCWQSFPNLGGGDNSVLRLSFAQQKLGFKFWTEHSFSQNRFLKYLTILPCWLENQHIWLPF
jgi:hypothetical protein